MSRKGRFPRFFRGRGKGARALPAHLSIPRGMERTDRRASDDQVRATRADVIGAPMTTATVALS